MNRTTTLPSLAFPPTSNANTLTQTGSHNSEHRFSSQLRMNFDCECKTIWLSWAPCPRPCFNSELLTEIAEFTDCMRQTKGSFPYAVPDCAYVVLASDIPGIFNTGGDLDLFIRLIETQDRAGIVAYGKICIDVLHAFYNSFDRQLTTIALIQGRCFGGGFESALACDIRVAERSAVFCFPEHLFGLWPGMGAWSFLLRKPGGQGLIDLLTLGKRYSAHEMQKLGLVDVVVEDGTGRDALQEMLQDDAVLQRIRSEKTRIDFDELWMSINIWATCALKLTATNRKLMRRFVGGQNQLITRGEREDQPYRKSS